MVLSSSYIYCIIWIDDLSWIYAGEAHSLKVEKVLFQGKSDYQNVMVFQVFRYSLLFTNQNVIIFSEKYWSLSKRSSFSIVNLNFLLELSVICYFNMHTCMTSLYVALSSYCSLQHTERFLYWME